MQKELHIISNIMQLILYLEYYSKGSCYRNTPYQSKTIA